MFFVETATGGDASVCAMLLANKTDMVQSQDRPNLERSGKCVPLNSGKSLAKVVASYMY